MRRRDQRAHVATALAGAFLAGEWDPPAMARRGKRALADRRHWLNDLALAVHHAYRIRPADRPRELARFVAACPPFTDAFQATDRPPPEVHVWMAAPTEMGSRRWPVPVIDDVGRLATWLGVRPAHLDWFADVRSLERGVDDERLRHHRRRWIAKPDGSARLLEAPKRELKDLQRQVLHHILDRIPPHAAAHGFHPGGSIHTAAAPHVGQAVLLRFDLEAFFTSISAGRVYGIFRQAGYPEPVAHTLAALCTTITPPAVLRAAPPLTGQTRRPGARAGAPPAAHPGDGTAPGAGAGGIDPGDAGPGAPLGTGAPPAAADPGDASAAVLGDVGASGGPRVGASRGAALSGDAGAVVPGEARAGGGPGVGASRGAALSGDAGGADLGEAGAGAGAGAPSAEQVDRRRRLLVSLAGPHLAQGAPTSPALANLAAHRLDRRLAGLADRLGAQYTRYADDLVLSGGRELLRAADRVTRLVTAIVADEGFRLNAGKTRVATAARRQSVTGIVVNRRPNVPRADYDQLKAVLHDAARHGPVAANRAGHPDFRAHLLGRISWVRSTNPDRAAKLDRAFTAIDW